MQGTILIAEDHDDVRNLTKVMVEMLGHKVIEAADGFEALELARKYGPDLILMDIAMPVMNGVVASKLIRETRACHNTPIVAVTAYSSEYLYNADSVTFDKVLEKPVELTDIEQVIKEFLAEEKLTEVRS
ncbi:MAG TPA: response regulator [Pyrinomonadaceae bacterium]|nr:response regulator [Pyrinomonadaceae bacterium]